MKAEFKVLETVFVKSHNKNGIIKKIYPNGKEIDVKFDDKVLPTKVKTKDCFPVTEGSVQ